MARPEPCTCRSLQITSPSPPAPSPVSETLSEQGQQWALPEEPSQPPRLTVASTSVHADSSGSGIPLLPLPRPLPLQLLATGLPPGSERHAVKEPLGLLETLGLERLARMSRSPCTTRPPTSDWSKQRRNGCLGLTLVASLGLPVLQLSALLLRCRTSPPWRHWDDTWPERWASTGARPRRGAQGNRCVIWDVRRRSGLWLRGDSNGLWLWPCQGLRHPSHHVSPNLVQEWRLTPGASCQAVCCPASPDPSLAQARIKQDSTQGTAPP